MDVSSLRTYLEREKGKKAQVEQDLNDLEESLQIRRRDLIRHEKAREIIRTVGIETQKQLQYHISDITSLALEAVFPEPYELLVEFVQRRNKTECDLLFKRGEMVIDPLDASGVGAVDVATFALRIASWSMAQPKSQPVIILDEPFRCLSTNYQEQASAMIKEISDKLGLQFIIITHEQALTSSADKIFEVSIRKGKSIVK